MVENFGWRRLKSLAIRATIAAGALIVVTFIGLVGVNNVVQAACEPHQIDLGEGKTVTGGCEPLKIAYLQAATNNVYLQANIQGAKDAAEAAGAEIKVFDANWTAATQFNQAQNVITSGRFNAILAEMNDGNQACTILSEDAPAANILVAVVNQPLCNRATAEGDGYWAPGTLNYVGGSQGREAFRKWFMDIAKENPGPQKVAVMTGPDLNSNTINTDAAIKDVQEAYPDFNIIAVVRTNYSVPQGNQKSLPLLQANPDLTILVSNYSDITRGAIQAVKQAGMADRLKIYDSGGNEWSFKAVRDGLITQTRTLNPYTEAHKGVQSLVAAWNNEKTPRYIPLEAVLITKDNVDKHKPEY
jgi:ribose transport system substrate-binding protein